MQHCFLYIGITREALSRAIHRQEQQTCGEIWDFWQTGLLAFGGNCSGFWLHYFAQEYARFEMDFPLLLHNSHLGAAETGILQFLQWVLFLQSSCMLFCDITSFWSVYLSLCFSLPSTVDTVSILDTVMCCTLLLVDLYHKNIVPFLLFDITKWWYCLLYLVDVKLCQLLLIVFNWWHLSLSPAFIVVE